MAQNNPRGKIENFCSRIHQDVALCKSSVFSPTDWTSEPCRIIKLSPPDYFC